MSRDFPVSGLAELDRFLSVLPLNMQVGAYRAALTAAAAVLRDEARLRAPKKTGKMAKAIKSGSSHKNSNGTISISVGLKGPHAFLGVFHEYGVAPHLIASTGKGQGRAAIRAAVKRGEKIGGVLKIGEDFVSGVISHPGHAAHPFMRPALDAKADAMVGAFAARIRDYIEGKTGFAAPLDEAA